MQQPLAYDVSEKSSSSSVGGRLAGPAFTRSLADKPDVMAVFGD